MYVATSKTIHYFCCVLASTSESKETRKSFSGSTLRPCCCAEMLKLLDCKEYLYKNLTPGLFLCLFVWTRKSFFRSTLRPCCCPEMLRMLENKCLSFWLLVRANYSSQVKWSHVKNVNINFIDSESTLHTCCCPEKLKLLERKK